MLAHSRLAVALLASILWTGGALAQSSSSTASFCDVAGTYMQDISAQRAAGKDLDAAIDEVAVAFDALATDADDLANRRRVLQTSRPLAVFAYGLHDLRPETVKQIGTAHCTARGGDVSLAPAPVTTAAIAAAAGGCERRAGEGSVDAGCIAKATDAQAASTATTEVARRTERERSSRAIQPFFEFGIGLGGDWLGTVTYADGSTEDMNAGDGLSMGGGFVHRINDRFGVKYTATYNVWSASATNASIIKSTMPIDIIPYYRTGDHKIGLGLSYHMSPKMDWDDLLPTMNFDDATGLTLEYGFRWFTFSWTDIDYEIGPASVDASRFTFKFSSTF